MLFLLQAWDSKMNYQVKDTMLEVDTKLKIFSEFLNKVKVLSGQREENLLPSESWTAKDTQLHEALLAADKNVHNALAANFNTSETINILTDIVNKSNAYIVGNNLKKALLLSKVAGFVVRILNIFGLEFNLSGSSSSLEVSEEARESFARPLAAEIANFRKAVRNGAKEKKDPSFFLDLSDKLRDEQMPLHGIKIVDDNEFSFFFVDKDELISEIAKKKAETADSAKQKQKRSIETKLAQLKKDLDKWEKNAQSPAEVVKAKYNVEISDPDQVPAADLSGKELSGSARKQIPRLWAQQQEASGKYTAEIARDPNFMSSMRAQIAELEKLFASL
jgi:cysteinyl-tRNA synthetase